MKMRLLFTLLLVCSMGRGAVGQEAGNTTLIVMTQNQYVGGDLLALATAADLASFMAAARATLADIGSSNFPERARALAREIAERRPDVVALQEVYDFRLNFVNGPPPFVDYLEETLRELEAAGARYVPVASVQNLNLTLPLDLDGNGTLESNVTVTDRDVILAHKDLVDGDAVVPVPLSTYCARPSSDSGPGCNYSVVASADTPLGLISFERGFVAVDVTVNGKTHRVVNTHLEVRTPDPSDPLSTYIQAAQATELKGVLETVTGPGSALIVAGDMNSDPRDSGVFVPPYRQFSEGIDLLGQPTGGGAYFDAWVLRPGTPVGNTCCQASSLLNRTSLLYERIDLVFTHQVPVDVKANVVGNERQDRTKSGLWPSDHAGLVVRFRF